MTADDIKWPRHKAGLFISRNGHKLHQSLEQWEEQFDARTLWVSEEERDTAIATDSVWSVVWFPDGEEEFYRVIASTLQACLDDIERNHFEET